MSGQLKRGLKRGTDGKIRCFWPDETPDYMAYHDDEWGMPVADDHRLFEKICLEGFQSGLSWLTILRKRENFRAAFANFDYEKIAKYGNLEVNRLLKDTGIVRHRGKIESTINNAKRAIEMVEEFGTLGAFSGNTNRMKKYAPKNSTTKQYARLLKRQNRPLFQRN